MAWTTVKKWLAMVCLAGGLAGPVLAMSKTEGHAEDKPSANQATPSVQSWMDQLNDESFEKRETATRQLIQRGAASVGPMEKLALEGKPEQAARAFVVLDRIAHGGAKTGRFQALEALKRLAANEDLRIRHSAEQALQAPEERLLNDHKPTTEQILQEKIGAIREELRGGVGPANLQRTRALLLEIQRLQLELMRLRHDQAAKKALQPGPPVQRLHAQRMAVVVRDGVTYRFMEKDGGITATLEGPNGKHTVFRARDAEELKKLSPEAHKVYEQAVGKRPHR